MCVHWQADHNRRTREKHQTRPDQRHQGKQSMNIYILDQEKCLNLCDLSYRSKMGASEHAQSRQTETESIIKIRRYIIV